jgi:hypothetical protein
MNGVVFNMKNPDATAADNHASWLELKLAEGWTLGETKDPIAKTHPCMVPYDELPKDQQTKDALYAAVVKTALAWCS